MRFKRLDTHKREKEKSRSLSDEEQSASESKGALLEIGESSAKGSQSAKGSLPLEWKSLAPFIETERSRQPSREYLEGFWGRLLPRLKVAIRHDAAVREYLRRTFWPRWAMRAAAAATILSLLVLLQTQRAELQTMRDRMFDLETRIGTPGGHL